MLTDKFLKYIEYEKRYSPLTVTAYRGDLGQFVRYLSEKYEISDLKTVNHPMIRSGVVNLIEQGISNRSVNRKISTLKSFYKFCMRDNSVSENPMLKILSPKTSRKLPVYVEEANMNELLEQVDYADNEQGVRDKLILSLFYSTGIRLSELINIKRRDIDLNEKNLKVLGKGNKERILPLSEPLLDELNEYMENSQDSAWLFYTNAGKKMYSKLVYRIVNSYLAKGTTITKKSPHVLRHTFATHMLNNGADLNAIKEFLGHANLAATQIYTHNSISKLSNIYKQAHPKA